MKILIISDAWLPQVNGVVRTYEHLRDELEAIGHQVRVIGPSEFPFRIPMPGYSEIQLALFPYYKLKKKIMEFDPTFIHVATEGPLGWAGRHYCVTNNVDYTSSYHTHFPDYVAKRVKKILPFMAEFARKMAIRNVKYFHTPARSMMIATQSLEDELNGWGFETPKHRLTRGVSLDIFHPGEKNLFQDLNRPVALYVGRVAIEKSIHKFLEMPWEGSKVVVGHGPSEDYFKKRYPDAHFVGKKFGKDLADHYRSSDVFVFPSKTDTFGIVLIEALACGLPVAAYDVTGPKDIITDKTLGVLGEDLADAAQEAMKHGTAQDRFEHVEEHYTWQKAAQQFLHAYMMEEDQESALPAPELSTQRAAE